MVMTDIGLVTMIGILGCAASIGAGMLVNRALKRHERAKEIERKQREARFKAQMKALEGGFDAVHRRSERMLAKHAAESRSRSARADSYSDDLVQSSARNFALMSAFSDDSCRSSGGSDSAFGSSSSACSSSID